MINKDNKKIIVISAILILAIVLISIGFYTDIQVDPGEEPENGEPDNGIPENGEPGELTGIVNYSGTWTGQAEGENVDGIWEFKVNFDEENLTGWFIGNASGRVNGSVYQEEIEAESESIWRTVDWSGSFSANGSEVSGEWKLSDLEGHGTWEGARGRANVDREEIMLPSEDQDSGEELIDRYPGSIMLDYTMQNLSGQKHVNAEYGTYDSVDEVVEWYKEELGEPGSERTENGKIEISYSNLEGFEEDRYGLLFISPGIYTHIEIQIGAR